MDLNLDALIESAIAYTGNGAHGERRPGIVAIGTTDRRRTWTREENQFYLDNLGTLSYRQIAERLGRSVEAVTIHSARHRMPAQTRQAGYMTANQVARLLSIDGHKIVGWMESGVMPFEYLPMEGRAIHRIAVVTLKRWLTRPVNWVYFKADRIKNPSIRRLVTLAQSRWGDEWLTTRQAEKLRGLPRNVIEHQVTHGHISAIRAKNVSGRHADQHWSYIYVRRSEVETCVIIIGKGGPDASDGPYTARSDAFIIRAKAAGKTFKEIGRMMKWKENTCRYRWYTLRNQMSNAEEITKAIKATLPRESRPTVFYGYDVKSNKYGWHVRLSSWPEPRFMGTSVDKALEFAADASNFADWLTM